MRLAGHWAAMRLHRTTVGLRDSGFHPSAIHLAVKPCQRNAKAMPDAVYRDSSQSRDLIRGHSGVEAQLDKSGLLRIYGCEGRQRIIQGDYDAGAFPREVQRLV